MMSSQKVEKIKRRKAHRIRTSAKLGSWIKFFARLFGRTPPDYHAWILADEVPAFMKFEGPLYTMGPVWRVELMSPSWPE
jgi:hypothetical protein